MRTCKHCGAPEAEAMTEVCPVRIPDMMGAEHPHEWNEVEPVDVRERVLAILHDAFPAALAQLALHCHDHEGHGDTMMLRDNAGAIEVTAEVVAECVQRELRRRFAKAADGKGQGT